MWIKRLLEDLRVFALLPTKVYYDNKVAISIVHNPVLHDKTKHVEVDKHFIKEKIDNGIICMPYISIVDQSPVFLHRGYTKINLKN